MGNWKRVKWTEAGQIADLLDWREGLGDEARVAPEDYFASLTKGGRLTDAVLFLGQALPRYETVAWAARAVRDLAPKAPPASPDAEALKATLLWVQDPSDARRRAAFEAAGRVRRTSPERLAALAAFFSGGSVTPADCPPVPAPNEAAGRFAAGAVLLAAARSGERDIGMAKALDAGALIAEHGIDATPP
jgi:hypothetical protein